MDRQFYKNYDEINLIYEWLFYFAPFFFILFLCVNESSMEDLLRLCKKQMDDMVDFNFSTQKWETASKFCWRLNTDTNAESLK